MPAPFLAALLPALGMTAGAGAATTLGTAAGGLIKGVGSAVLGSQIDRMKRRQELKDQYGIMGDMGLTPQEMVGAGVPGSSGGATTVLGNREVALESQARQIQYDEKRQDKQLANERWIAELQAETQLGNTLLREMDPFMRYILGKYDVDPVKMDLSGLDEEGTAKLLVELGIAGSAGAAAQTVKKLGLKGTWNAIKRFVGRGGTPKK